jgi:hypothetical protein
MDNIQELFFSIPGLIMLGSILSGWVTTKLATNMTSIMKKLVSIVSIGAICAIGAVKELGFFANTSTLYDVIASVGIIGITQGLYDIGALNSILALFFAKK